MVSHHLKPNCKSLYQKFDVLLTLSFIAGHLALNYSHIAGVFSPPMSFTLLPLEQNVPQIYMWLLFISSNPLLGWLFSIIFHNQRSPFSPLQKQNPSPKSCWALPLSLLFSVKWTSFLYGLNNFLSRFTYCLTNIVCSFSEPRIYHPPKNSSW